MPQIKEFTILPQQNTNKPITFTPSSNKAGVIGWTCFDQNTYSNPSGLPSGRSKLTYSYQEPSKTSKFIRGRVKLLDTIMTAVEGSVPDGDGNYSVSYPGTIAWTLGADLNLQVSADTPAVFISNLRDKLVAYLNSQEFEQAFINGRPYY